MRDALEPEEVLHPLLLDVELGRGVISDESQHEVEAEVAEEASTIGGAVRELIGETNRRLKSHLIIIKTAYVVAYNHELRSNLFY